jgi:GNAT superfamily N-acetyltransferase
MIELREAVSDPDLEDSIRVRRADVPNESASTVELLRAHVRRERLLLLAQLDGELAGSGLSDRSDIGDRFALKPRVLPRARRRGVGTALMRALAAHAERFDEDGLTVVRRDRRGRGVAHALKRMELVWAAANGNREVVTRTQQGNEAMRRVNERLGYVYRDESVTMLAPLPLR